MEIPVLFGVFIESVVFYANEFGVKRNFDWRMIVALVGGIGLAVAFQQDVFVDYVAIVPYVGNIATGIIFSRAANATHDIIQRVRGE